MRDGGCVEAQKLELYYVKQLMRITFINILIVITNYNLEGIEILYPI
jgi:hypothetical protein